ncbi:MAG: phospholipase D-like domain-containing protein, partial [Myxococcales bacterium]
AAYFVPDRRMLAALKDARRRGVQVKLMLAGKSDVPVVQLAGRASYERLLGWGVQIHEWCAAVFHAKTAVVDGVWATVGSFNLDRWSMLRNHELNVVFADPGIAGTLQRAFESDCTRCTRIEPGTWAARPWRQRVLQRLAWIFRRWL